MYLIAIFVTLCGLSVVTQDVGLGLALSGVPWLAMAAVMLWRRAVGIGALLPTRRTRSAELEAIADRLRARLDADAAMVLRAWHACAPRGEGAMRDQLLTFCQHALDRTDMFALADHGSTLAYEFRDWLGDDLLGHIRFAILPRAGNLSVPARAGDARLESHARRHGWLAPSTLALARSGSPIPAAPAQQQDRSASATVADEPVLGTVP
ncbi:MAG: hypothetical protein Q4G49_14365 [Paracoccus sp. (in: a-proteobacteria)]|nr:hypothetical protein [Paracoccus sp. (in: a-proteobacteria)]